MVKKLLNFTKIEHTAFSLPMIFSGAWLGASGHWPSLEKTLLIVIAAVGARIFGMAFNRIFDRKLDALNPRTANRELPRGDMSLLNALAVAAAGLVSYLFACRLLGGWCFKLSFLPLIPLLLYSLLKRFTWLCHFGIGLCLSLAPIGAFVATAGDLRFSLPVLFFAFFVFCWMSGSDIIYAIMDIESDRINNVFSLPAHFGADRAIKVAAMVHGLAVLSLFGILFLLGNNGAAMVATLLAVIAFAIMYIPVIPVGIRFFPISTIAGITGALVPMLAG